MSHDIIGRDPRHPSCGCNSCGSAGRYERAIAEAEAAKRKFIEEAMDLQDVAKETNATANKNEILAAINVALDKFAKEANATANKEEILAAITHVIENSTANKEEILEAVLQSVENLAKEDKATANKDEILDAIAELHIFEECSVSDILKMFNEFGAPFVWGEDGYIHITNMVQQDDEGYLILPSPALDLERYIEVVTI